ncbi:bilin reductase [Ruminiclostridium herbifermentans]|uniref:Bilin reductase n=1 Tax=Ruminiclostridium herbifermentans TaxID=2488810 RepID=A0A4U7JCM1_9FIRM|nr:bilin reductase [Ruminiclostridium herbifermentans]QNU67754.1 bilin reductase [Ruminiclostridium herbifermentans]
MDTNEVFISNIKAIDTEINDGFNILNKNYKLVELDCGCFSNLKIQNIVYDIKQYNIVGVGNLLMMVSKESTELQMLSFVITPYYKNLPLFSNDYLFMKEKRSFIIEYYDLVKDKDSQYNAYINKLKVIKDKYADLPDMKQKECWNDSLKSVCIAKRTSLDHDNDMFSIFNENLHNFIEAEQNSSILSEYNRKIKWQITKDYVDKLIDIDGVSTNVFKNTLGAETTRKFFHDVFFGIEKFKI